MEAIYDTLPPVLPEFEPLPPSLAPASDLPPEVPAGNQEAGDFGKKPERRPGGKIAKLPTEVRERLNELLEQGHTYSEVLRELGEPAAHLNQMDISRWMHNGGYSLWLQQQAWTARTQASFAACKEIIKDNEGMSIHEANLHLAATQIYESIIGSKPGDLPLLLREDSDKIIKILQAIPRYSQQALNYQKFREACAQAQTEVQRLRDPHRELTDSERNAILDKLDRILGLK